MNHRTAALLILALAVLGACASPRATGSPAPSGPSAPTPTPVGGAEMCTIDQLGLVAGRVEGAAGTTYVSVEVTREAGARCQISAWPNARIVDAAGDLVIETPASTRVAELVTLSQTAIYNLGWSSWCGALPVGPLVLQVGLIGDDVSLLELPADYKPSGCLGESNLTIEPAS